VSADVFPRPCFESKITPPEALSERVARLPSPVVMTNGCFDILHAGHVTYLAQARALGASLIVALNTDASVQRLGKGKDRPFNALSSRLCVIAALASTDIVTWFDEDTPLSLIHQCSPAVLVKGGDWRPEHIVGADWVLAHGGAVHSIPFEHPTSTTLLVNRIRGLAGEVQNTL
jgi:D-glycero-beta-D-manno-heptose 1-phosphate adenylyltransferase